MLRCRCWMEHRPRGDDSTWTRLSPHATTHRPATVHTSKWTAFSPTTRSPVSAILSSFSTVGCVRPRRSTPNGKHSGREVLRLCAGTIRPRSYSRYQRRDHLREHGAAHHRIHGSDRHRIHPPRRLERRRARRTTGRVAPPKARAQTRAHRPVHNPRECSSRIPPVHGGLVSGNRAAFPRRDVPRSHPTGPTTFVRCSTSCTRYGLGRPASSSPISSMSPRLRSCS